MKNMRYKWCKCMAPSHETCRCLPEFTLPFDDAFKNATVAGATEANNVTVADLEEIYKQLPPSPPKVLEMESEMLPDNVACLIWWNPKHRKSKENNVDVDVGVSTSQASHLKF